jgi:predicted glycoside hydrolase/deacetylase ChbG (UPF0249 family)
VKVVFHADDFGLTRAINAGIVEACERGPLRSTSLMVTAGAAEDAAAAARTLPALDVGLHVTLVEERPVLPPERIPTLVDEGRFWRDHSAVFARYVAGRWNPVEARAEVAAQFVKLMALGLRPSHCDGHQHLHLLPKLFPAVVELAHANGAQFVRSQLGGPVGGEGSLGRRLSQLALRGISRFARGRLAPDTRAEAETFVTIGFLEAGGRLTTARLLTMLDELRARHQSNGLVVEVMLHPGRRDRETERRYGHWHYAWERDLELLLDPALPEGLARRGIEVTSFRALAAERGAG